MMNGFRAKWLWLLLALAAGSVRAGYTNGFNLVSTYAGGTLVPGYVYVVSNSCTMSSSGPGLRISDKASAENPVVIYIEKGVTLTVKGKDGSGTIPGCAGISFDSAADNAALVVTGEGKLVAKGGAAGDGSNGSDGYSYAWDDANYAKTRGGNGGDGGGGAGAGVGTGGTDGGGRGECLAYSDLDWKRDSGIWGYNGSRGYSGDDAFAPTSKPFAIYAMGQVSITAEGGKAGAGGAAGNGASRDYSEGSMFYSYAGSSGGGGGGGGGYAGAPFGSGGGGGGGGGAGGGGAVWWRAKKVEDNAWGGQGVGGYGGANGLPNPDTASTDSEYGSAYDYDDFLVCGGYRGWGGKGGGKGIAAGKVYLSPSASVTASEYVCIDVDRTPPCIEYEVKLVKDALSEPCDSIKVMLGGPYPSQVFIPDDPVMVFDGWWTEPDGGTEVYDGSGKVNPVTYKTFGDTTLYAHWHVRAEVEVSVNGRLITEGSGPGWTYDQATELVTIVDDTASPYVIAGVNITSHPGLRIEVASVNDVTLQLDEFVNYSTGGALAPLAFTGGAGYEVKFNGACEIVQNGTEGAGVYVSANSSLTLRSGETGTCRLVVDASKADGAGIGGCLSREDGVSGAVTILDGVVKVRGGSKGADIGGASKDVRMVARDDASGAMEAAAETGTRALISRNGGTLRILGGNVQAQRNRVWPRPLGADGRPLFAVPFIVNSVEGSEDQSVRFGEPPISGYGMTGFRVFDHKFVYWLPTGYYEVGYEKLSDGQWNGTSFNVRVTRESVRVWSSL